MRNDKAAQQGGGRGARAGSGTGSRPRQRRVGRVIAELASHGPYGVVVHNAATGVIRPALETEDRHWDWTLSANARALLSLARAVRTRHGARLVDRCDLVTRLDARARELRARRGRRRRRSSPSRATSPSSSHRGALRQHRLRRCRRDGSPGALPEPRADGGCGAQADAGGRLVEPEDVAAAVAYLCSPDAEMMIRGHTLIVDGGYSLLA